MQLTRKEFKKSINSSAKFLLNTGGIIFLIFVMILIYSSINNMLENKGYRNAMTLALIICAVNFAIYFIYNFIQKEKQAKQLYDKYLKYGFINREYRLNKNNQFLVLIHDGEKEIKQKDYDLVWNAFEEYLEKNGNKLLNNLVMKVLVSKNVSSKELDDYIQEFRKYLEKNKLFKNNFSSKCVIRIYPVINNYVERNELYMKNIMYFESKIVYFKSK